MYSHVLEDLVTANQILVAHAVLDAFGHVSARDPQHPERFFLSRNLAPAQVTSEDVQSFDLQGNTTDTRKPYLERFIHAAIYQSRPDVQAIVHSHATVVAPFTVTARPLLPVIHTAGFLARGVPRFDIRGERGDMTNLLITDMDLGTALAHELGDSAIALMRGHGYVSAGSSIPIAVMQAIYTQANARVLLDALVLGEPEYLSSGEGAASASAGESQVQRAWSVWARAVKHDRMNQWLD